MRDVDAALEAPRRLGAKAKSAARAANARAVERGGLQDDSLRRVGDFRFQTAHDTGKTRGLFRIGNDEFRSLGAA